MGAIACLKIDFCWAKMEYMLCGDGRLGELFFKLGFELVVPRNVYSVDAEGEALADVAVVVECYCVVIFTSLEIVGLKIVVLKIVRLKIVVLKIVVLKIARFKAVRFKAVRFKAKLYAACGDDFQVAGAASDGGVSLADLYGDGVGARFAAWGGLADKQYVGCAFRGNL